MSLHCNTCRPLLSSPTFFPLCRLSITPVYGRIGNHLPRNGAQSHLIPHASTHPNLLSPTQTLFPPLPGSCHLRQRDVYGGENWQVWSERVRSEWLTPLAPHGSAGGPAFINTPQLSLAWIKQNVFHTSWVLLYPIIVNIVFSSIQLKRNIDFFSISVLIVEIHIRVSLSRFGTLNETQSVRFIPRIHLLIGVCNIHMHADKNKAYLFCFSAAFGNDHISAGY